MHLRVGRASRSSRSGGSGARLGILGLCVVLGSPLGGLADPPEVPSFAREVPSVRSGSPVLAFNGKDLTGFYTYLHDHKYNDPDHVFTVSDGHLRISGQEWGGLATRDEFADY